MKDNVLEVEVSREEIVIRITPYTEDEIEAFEELEAMINETHSEMEVLSCFHQVLGNIISEQPLH